MLGELFGHLTAFLNEISSGNQMIAGALSLWLMSVLTYLARGVPKAIYVFLKRNLTTSLTLNNAGWSEQRIAMDFYRWLRPKLSSALSRTLSVQSTPFWDDNKRVELGLGFGSHIFFHNRRIYWINKSSLESGGSERQKEEIVITTLGRSHEPFQRLLEEVAPEKEANKFQIYTVNTEGKGWEALSTPPKRPLDTVAADPEFKQLLVSQIQHFRDSQDWFYARGLPYKMTYLLHGAPGTGKTSLIKALASHFNANVCILNLSVMSDIKLDRLLSTVPKNSFVVIEDFDSTSATQDRNVKQQQSGSGGDLDDFLGSGLTLSGLLNTLDGIKPLDDCVLFLTTNHLDHLDPALYRRGRVDHIFEIKKAAPEEVRVYAKHIYPDHDWSRTEFEPTLGCYLNEALLVGKDDPKIFLECLEGSWRKGDDDSFPMDQKKRSLIVQAWREQMAKLEAETANKKVVKSGDQNTVTE